MGCGSSGGVPRPALGWGVCDPNNPKNRRRRTSFLAERRTADGVTRILVDTSPDLREQLLDANVDWVDAVLFTHEHADHTHGIDDLRGLFINRRKRVPVWLDERVSQIMHARFGYCFAAAPGSEYPPMVRENRMEAVSARSRSRGREARSPPCPSSRSMATSPRSASASAAWPIPATSSGLPPDSVTALEGLDVWIIDALRDKPHPSHLSVSEALDWIESLKPKRAILTNLHTDLDYDELRSRLPSHVEPAYDGLTHRTAGRVSSCRHFRAF